VAVAHHLAEIGDLADLPQQAAPRPGLVASAATSGLRDSARSTWWSSASRFWISPRADGGSSRLCEHAPTELKLERGIAPGDAGQRLEFVRLDRADDLGIERPFIGRGAERAVVHVAAGAPGDLADLGGGEPR
jgi:hypothetical protein